MDNYLYKRNLLIFRTGSLDESEIVEELKTRSWNILATHNQQAAREFLEHHRIPVGIAYFNSFEPTRSCEQISLIRSNTSVKWIALLDRLPSSNSPLSSIIYANCCDFLIRPIDIQRLLFSISHVYGKAKDPNRKHDSRQKFEQRFNMIGRSPLMRELFSIIDKASDSDEFVMIHGETGTGKELIARAIHDHSSRRDKPFVPINCASLSKDLIFSELFGHAKGAFTDAYNDTQGLLESANGGTVFFDEVGELQLDQQAALLRFVQDKCFYRLGDNCPVTIDVRIVSATNKDVPKALKSGEFREDLYYRLNVLGITSPPLRHRADDSLLIARYLLYKSFKSDRIGTRTYSKDAINAICAYSWPGNVRELIHSVNRALALSDGPFITARDLKLEIDAISEHSTLKEVREQAESNAIRNSLVKTGNVTYTARELGVSRVTLHRLLKKYSIRLPN